MLRITLPILDRAETLAARGAGLADIFGVLRELSLEDFGIFMISLPSRGFPALSTVLPPMASIEIQKAWTGNSGNELLRQTSAFVRILQSNCARHRTSSLAGRRIMDFGVGYGRIFRMMYYFSNPDRLWGVDAWQRSLDHCLKARLPGNFRLSDAVPAKLPVEDSSIDLAYAFSVFTHLSPQAAAACAVALRKAMAKDGLLFATVRPFEFWKYRDKLKNTSNAATFEKAHLETGFAYELQVRPEGQSYGESSMEPGYFERFGWRVLGIDRTTLDPYQLVVILEPA